MEEALSQAKFSARDAGTVSLGGEVSLNRLGFGAMHITGEGIWGPPKDRAAAVALLRRAVELGVNFIDTADAYGPNVSEEIIAEALSPFPRSLVIATKGGWKRSGPGLWMHDASPDNLRQAVDGSLKRLRVERIELYFLHAPDHGVSFDASVETLAELRTQGKIRFVGLSNVTREHIERARKIVPVVAIENRYSFADREWEYVLQYCEQNRMVFIPWGPIGGGKMAYETAVRIAKKQNATPFQVALAWLLAHSPITLPIPGTSSVTHLEENIRAAQLDLTDEELAELFAVKKKFTVRGA
jgi:aryl-alcohol dehydrogenase-like predicted oxidoreductase